MEKKIKKSVKVSDEKQIPEIELPTLDTLLQAGSHFGHRSSTWNPKMRPFVYAERNGVHIIDLIKTLTSLKVALAEIQKAAQNGSVMIIGTKGQAATMVQQMALQKGAFYVNKRWPGGLFTNFKAVKKSIDKLVKMELTLASGNTDLVKKEELLMRREIGRLNQVYEGTKFMDKLPSLVIVIDSKVEKNAIRECNNMGIPVAALVDTNCDPTLITFPIPANDDSLKSISLFIELFGKALDGSKVASTLISTRITHATTLEQARIRFEEEKARTKAMEEEEIARLKALRQGVETERQSVVRVVNKKEEAISDTTLSARTKKALMDAGYNSVEKLAELSEKELSEIKGIGPKALEEVIKVIKK